MRIGALFVGAIVAGCASDPPPPAVTVGSASPAPLVVGHGDTARPTPAKRAAGDEVLDDQPELGAHPVGAKAPGFVAKSMNGRAVSPFKDRITVVHFWATWVAPARRSMPGLQRIFDKHHADGVDVIGVSVDDESGEIAAFAKDVGVTFPVGWDEGSRIVKRWAVKAMPSTYVVAREGVVRFVHEGYFDGDEDAIEKDLEQLR